MGAFVVSEWLWFVVAALVVDEIVKPVVSDEGQKMDYLRCTYLGPLCFPVPVQTIWRCVTFVSEILHHVEHKTCHTTVQQPQQLQPQPCHSPKYIHNHSQSASPSHPHYIHNCNHKDTYSPNPLPQIHTMVDVLIGNHNGPLLQPVNQILHPWNTVVSVEALQE